MRMRAEGHRQYHQKSLRTKNFETAKERAKVEHAIALVKMTEGKSLFSPTLYKAIEMFLEHRAKDVLSGAICEGRLLAKAQAVVRKRLKGNFIDSDDEDELIDKEMRVYKVDCVRTTRKKSIRTNTHKLINKAVANIQAVEKGMFGVGH